jgi:hypothetical protein
MIDWWSPTMKPRHHEDGPHDEGEDLRGAFSVVSS